MHDIFPNAKYAIVTVHLACPIGEDGDAGITDGLNDMFRQHIVDMPDDVPALIADWEFIGVGKLPMVMSSDNPEEGELFHRQQSALENFLEKADSPQD
jgi:hypothetical protein